MFVSYQRPVGPFTPNLPTCAPYKHMKIPQIKCQNATIVFLDRCILHHAVQSLNGRVLSIEALYRTSIPHCHFQRSTDKIVVKYITERNYLSGITITKHLSKYLIVAIYGAFKLIPLTYLVFCTKPSDLYVLANLETSIMLLYMSFYLRYLLFMIWFKVELHVRVLRSVRRAVFCCLYRITTTGLYGILLRCRNSY